MSWGVMMVNTQLLLEATIRWLITLREDDEFLAGIGIMGTYGENQKIPIVLCSIEGKDTIIDSIVRVDLMSNTQWRLKIEDYHITLTVYAAIEEECNKIVEKYIDKIESTYTIPTSKEIKIKRVLSSISTSNVKPDKLSGERLFSKKMAFNVRVNDLIEKN